MRAGRWIPVLVVGLLAAAFVWLNRGEMAVLRLGFATFYRVPVSLVVLGSVVLGMVTMFLLSLPTDLRVRRVLRERGEEDHDLTEAYSRSYTQVDYQ